MKEHILYLGVSIAFLNLFDAIATNYGVSAKLIEEMNPLMNQIISYNPGLFISTKTALTLLILLVSYWIYAKSKASFQKMYLVSLAGVFCLYCGVCGLHVYWLTAV